jgi:hypothetical protein
MEPPLAWPTTLDICMNGSSTMNTVLACYVGWMITVVVSLSILIWGGKGFGLLRGIGCWWSCTNNVICDSLSTTCGRAVDTCTGMSCVGWSPSTWCENGGIQSIGATTGRGACIVMVEPRLELGRVMAGVTVPGVFIAGTAALTGVTMFPGVTISATNTNVVRCPWWLEWQYLVWISLQHVHWWVL